MYVIFLRGGVSCEDKVFAKIQHTIGPNCLKARPVQFGALPAAAEQLFAKPRSRPKIEPNFAGSISWFFLKEKPQNSYEPGGLAKSLVSGTPKFSKPPLFGHGRG